MLPPFTVALALDSSAVVLEPPRPRVSRILSPIPVIALAGYYFTVAVVCYKRVNNLSFSQRPLCLESMLGRASGPGSVILISGTFRHGDIFGTAANNGALAT